MAAAEKRHWILLPGVTSGILISVAVLSAVASAVVLEMFAIRMEGVGSLTTMFPGFVYASAFILKVSLFEAAVLLIFTVASRFLDSSRASSGPQLAGPLSILLPAIAPLLGAVTIVVTQAVWDLPQSNPYDYYSRLSRIGVLVTLGTIFAGTLSAIQSLRSERPIGISVIGLVTSIVYVVVFRYWEFYRLGFDQDRWNSI